jgi:hypothetical protein
VDTAITCKDFVELTDVFEDKLVERFRRREDGRTSSDSNELDAWQQAAGVRRFYFVRLVSAATTQEVVTN